MWKKILLVLLAIFVLIQFHRPPLNVTNAAQPNDISQVYAVPANVESILKKACNDCHTNNTKYPWYAQIQPVRFWLNRHVKEGKQELNFNDFKTFTPRRQYIKLEEVIKQIDEDEMPLYSFTLVHTDARLSAIEKEQVIDWAKAIRDTMKATYPADSLARKKKYLEDKRDSSK